VHKFRLENERFLEDKFKTFKDELLAKIEVRPEGFIDGEFKVKVLGGKVNLAEISVAQPGWCFTDRFQPGKR
jgi:hypothetical protein